MRNCGSAGHVYYYIQHGVGVISLVPLPTYLPFYVNVTLDLSKTIQLE